MNCIELPARSCIELSNLRIDKSFGAACHALLRMLLKRLASPHSSDFPLKALASWLSFTCVPFRVQVCCLKELVSWRPPFRP